MFLIRVVFESATLFTLGIHSFNWAIESASTEVILFLLDQWHLHSYLKKKSHTTGSAASVNNKLYDSQNRQNSEYAESIQNNYTQNSIDSGCHIFCNCLESQIAQTALFRNCIWTIKKNYSVEYIEIFNRKILRKTVLSFRKKSNHGCQTPESYLLDGTKWFSMLNKMGDRISVTLLLKKKLNN
jgi:hypothetical protein